MGRRSWFFALPAAVMLLVSACTHIENDYFFLSSIYSYEFVGRDTGVILAVMVPFVQLAIALTMLFDPRGRRAAAVISLVCFSGFILVQSIILAKGIELACGCFGPSSRKIGTVSLSIAVIGWVSSLLAALIAPRAIAPKVVV